MGNVLCEIDIVYFFCGMHCRSDAYLAEELIMEYDAKEQ